ncbi:MAG: hypothetical protein Q8M17_10595 [Actinomycetota bacterium]|nr:hypothetical protein [Actinomycetota bacterium]
MPGGAVDVAPPAATVIRQMQAAILEARAAAFAFQRLGRSAPPTLAWRCDQVARAIVEGLRESFGDGVL